MRQFSRHFIRIEGITKETLNAHKNIQKCVLGIHYTQEQLRIGPLPALFYSMSIREKDVFCIV